MDVFSDQTSQLDRPQRARTPKAELTRRINDVMERQAGRISFEQLRGLGLSRQQIATRRLSGELIIESKTKPRSHRPGRARPRTDMTRRVYRSPGAPMTPDGRRWAAVLSAPAVGFVDHVSSLQLHGLEDPSYPVHVLVEGGGWEGPVGVKEHRTRSLPAVDRTTVRGINATTVPRALIAAAADIDRERLHDLLDTAVRLGKYDGDQMIRVLESRQMVAGYKPLTAAVAALDSTSGTFRSIFERRTMRLVEQSSLIPVPVVNVLVYGYRPDLHVAGTRAIIECDGRDYHRSPAQIIADDRRQRILEARGFRFLRLRWADVVYNEEQTLARIERFVLANSEPPVPGV